MKKMTNRVAMVVFSHYVRDPRVRREAEALIEAGMSVDVFCLRLPDESKRSELNNVSIYRLPLTRKKSGKLNYLWEYSFFIFVAFFVLTAFHLRKRYDVIHVHNMPEVLVLSALIPRLTGARVILDLHDPMPEMFMTKYGVSELHPVIRLIKFVEKCCIRFADAVLTPNIAFRDLFVSRGCPPWKIHVIMNTPQETVFNLDPDAVPAVGKNGFVIMYHGGILGYNGLDMALEAIGCIRSEIPNLRFEVYGDGEFKEEFLNRVNELRLTGIVRYHGQKPVERIADAIKLCTLGIIPNRKSVFTNLNLPVRIFEYLAMKKPVIAPCTQGIRDYFDEHSLLFFEAGNVESLKSTILDAYHNPLRCEDVLEQGFNVYKRHRWELEKKHLIEVVRNTIGVW